MDKSNRIKIAAKIFDAIRAVTGSSPSPNLIQEALDALRRMSEAKSIPIAIVGGLATIHYGYPTSTQDVDIVISTADDDKFCDSASQFGFKVEWRAKSRWHTLSYKGVEINVVPEGGRAKKTSPTNIPGPQALGVTQGLDYASLEGWVELKVSAGRSKDEGHVVEVLKTLPISSIQKIQTHLTSVHSQYLDLFDQWLAKAQAEKQQEKDRFE